LQLMRLRSKSIQLFVRNAIDIKNYLYKGYQTRSIIDALILLRAMLSCCDNRPLVIIDRGPLYLCTEKIRLRVQACNLWQKECYRKILQNSEEEDKAILQQY